MKTLYIECTMGAAGDMPMAALLELHNDPTRTVAYFFLRHRIGNVFGDFNTVYFFIRTKMS